ncbi:MAG: helix-turn-helix domain-containing protein [Pseudomonadota bacterium]
MTHLGFHDALFDPHFLTCVRADGSVVRFTRRERALLTLLAPNAGRLFSRDELVGALGCQGADRNVDFVVNRVRSKLMDTGRVRRFIATQYGEGYVWVATPESGAKAPPFVSIGPIRGRRSPVADAMLEAVRSGLERRSGRPVLMAPDAVAAKTDPGPTFVVDVSLYAADGCLHAAFGVAHRASGEVVATLRGDFGELEAADVRADALAADLFDTAWRYLAMGASGPRKPADPPLEVRLAVTAMLLASPGGAWSANEARLAQLRESAPDDPGVAILWAMHLLGRAVAEPGPDVVTRESVAALDREIEHIVFKHLPAVRNDPLLALGAAKLLLMAGCGHEDIAESLANTAFTGSAAFAAAIPLLGQIKACRGDIPEAVRLFDVALGLCEPASTFELYIQVLKATALIAADARAELEAVYRRLGEIAADSLPRFAVLFLPADDAGLARQLAPLADRLSPILAQRIPGYLFYRIARNFRSPQHVANIMRGPLTHLIRRFGATVVSPSLWDDLPDELYYLRGA